MVSGGIEVDAPKLTCMKSNIWKQPLLAPNNHGFSKNAKMCQIDIYLDGGTHLQTHVSPSFLLYVCRASVITKQQNTQ